jgi:hypothetical protein
MQEWKSVRTCATVEAFDAAWAIFEQRLNQKMRDYFNKEWFPYRTNFVHAWTKQVRNYGHSVDSRIESMHAQMKRHIVFPSRTDFIDLLNALARYTAHQLQEVQAAEYKDAMQNMRKLQVPPLMALGSRVSTYALNIVHEKVTEARASIQNQTQLSPCTGDFERVMGLPCTHKCKAALTEGGAPLVTEDFCFQWRLPVRNGEPLDRQALHILPPPPKRPKKTKKTRIMSGKRVKTVADSGRLHSQIEILRQIPLGANAVPVTQE